MNRSKMFLDVVLNIFDYNVCLEINRGNVLIHSRNTHCTPFDGPLYHRWDVATEMPHLVSGVKEESKS